MMTVIMLIMTVVGIWGLSDFKRFFEGYCKLMDSRNTSNIKYPKGKYAKVVLIITLVMSLTMGLAGLLGSILIGLKLR